MIEREIAPCLVELFEQYPFVTVTGPRQSGKTTLCRAAFPHLDYVNLEAPDQREFAESDPRGFLARLRRRGHPGRNPACPRSPVLPSGSGRRGGTEQPLRSDRKRALPAHQRHKPVACRAHGIASPAAVSRSSERRQTGASDRIDDILYSGFYPRIHDRKLEPRQALGDYFETYVERDVRRIGEIRNLANFRRFVRLCAGRVGQLANLSSLGADAGVSHTTASHWLTVLEASYVVFRLPPFHANIRKRLVKTPKLYFYDVGLASHLIGIELPDRSAPTRFAGRCSRMPSL